MEFAADSWSQTTSLDVLGLWKTRFHQLDAKITAISAIFIFSQEHLVCETMGLLRKLHVLFRVIFTKTK